MTPSIDSEWHGVWALIWLLFGLVVTLLIEKFVNPLFTSYFVPLWVIGGWLIPAFLLAVSGIRNGNVASRVCAVLVIIALASPILFILYVGHQLHGR